MRGEEGENVLGQEFREMDDRLTRKGKGGKGRRPHTRERKSGERERKGG